MKYGQHTDLTTKMQEFEEPLKSRKRNKNEFTQWANTNFYVQKYQNTTLLTVRAHPLI